MLPTTASSQWIRNEAFVREEWEAYFSSGRVDEIDSGWRGVLYANLALVEAGESWRFFCGESAVGWSDGWLDDGMSRSWSLAMAAGLGGAL